MYLYLRMFSFDDPELHVLMQLLLISGKTIKFQLYAKKAMTKWTCIWILLTLTPAFGQEKSIEHPLVTFASLETVFFDGDYQTAYKYAEQLTFQYDSADHVDSLIMALNYQGLAALNSSRDGLKPLERAQTLFLKTPGLDSALLAQTYYHLAKNSGNQGRFKESVDWNQKSIQLRLRLSGPLHASLAGNYNMLGYCYRYLGNYEKADSSYRMAIVIWENYQGEPVPETGKTYDGLGWISIARGDPVLALKYLKTSLDHKRIIHEGDHPSVSNTLHWMSTAYFELSNYQKALQLAEEAAAMRIKTLGPQHVNVGVSYGMISDCYLSMGDFEKSITYRKQQIAIYQSFLSEAYLLNPYSRLALAFEFNGQPEEQLKAFSMADDAAKRAGTFGNQYMINNHLQKANYYQNIENDSARLNELLSALNLVEHLVKSPGQEAKVNKALGEYYMDQEEMDKAQTYFQKALEYYKNTLGLNNTSAANAFLAMGKLEFNKGNLDEAMINFQQSVECLQKNGTKMEPNAPIDPAIYTNLYAVIKGLSWIGKTYQAMYTANQNMAHLKDEMATYENGMVVLNYLRASMMSQEAQLRVVQVGTQLINHAIALTFQLHQLEPGRQHIQKAFEFSELSKSMILRGAINEHKSMVFHGVPDSLMIKERTLKGEIAYLKKKMDNKLDSLTKAKFQARIFQLEQSFDLLIKKIEHEYPDYYRQKYQNASLDFTALEAKLKEDKALLVSYFLTRENVFIVSVTPEEWYFNRIRRSDRLDEMLDLYRRSTTDFEFIIHQAQRADSSYLSSAYYLYHHLLKPAIRDNQTLRKIVIVPHNELGTINFESFLSEPLSKPRYSSLPYLIRDFEVLYQHSASFYVQQENRRSADAEERYAGFAPAYQNPEPIAGLGAVRQSASVNLPFAIEEVKQAALSNQGKIWINGQATENEFKQNASRYKTLHLAMHGYIDQQNPGNSRLMFSASKDSIEDGYLYLDEIYNLPLHADMVVLSACESGTGKLQHGEGSISLSRAFNYAGCKSVVMSQWKVPDKASKEIIVSFFEGINDGMEKSQALRKAKLDYLKNTEEQLYAHPFFWAGFVVTGSDDPIINSTNSWWYYIAALTVAIVLALWTYYRKHSF